MNPLTADDAQLGASIRLGEGFVSAAYPDPLSATGEPLTIGYGHTAGVKAGDTCSLLEAARWLIQDIQNAMDLLDTHASWWRSMTLNRQRVLAEMCFNMGWGNGDVGLSSFRYALSDAQKGDYASAAFEFEDSAWFKQVGARGKRLVDAWVAG